MCNRNRLRPCVAAPLRAGSSPRGRRPRNPHGGLTLVELLIALTVLVLTIGALGGLARAVQQSAAYGEGHGTAMQHGRVILERTERMLNEAHANEHFPGCLVLAETVGSWQFPDTLVVWHPEGEPADPEGLPRFEELVVYTPSESNPNQLLEIDVQLDSRTVPSPGDMTAWLHELEAIKKASDNRRVVLSDLVRVGTVSDGNLAEQRAAVRFVHRLRPSAQQWTEYRDGARHWDDLPWAQGIHGSETGLRQSWIRSEIQLMPGEQVMADDPGGQQAIPFFGSSALYYELPR